MKNILRISLLLMLTQLNYAQSSLGNSVIPIKLDKSALSGVGLEKIDIKGEPEKDFYQKNLYKGEDLSVYIVSTESWVNKMENFPFDEFVYMYHGQAKITPIKGPTQTFYTGEYFFAPKGYTGDWEIISGKNLHYEFSVISTRRAEKPLDKVDNHHQLFDKALISGVDISLDTAGLYSKILQEGAELTICIKAEAPVVKNIVTPSKESVLHLLSGQITLTDQNKNVHLYQSGDFIIIPKGFMGEWLSEGHGLIKYLTIERS